MRLPTGLYYGSDIPSHPWYLPYLNNPILCPCGFWPFSSRVSDVLLHGRRQIPWEFPAIRQSGTRELRLAFANQRRKGVPRASAHDAGPEPDDEESFDGQTTPVHSFQAMMPALHSHYVRSPFHKSKSV